MIRKKSIYSTVSRTLPRRLSGYITALIHFVVLLLPLTRHCRIRMYNQKLQKTSAFRARWFILNEQSRRHLFFHITYSWTRNLSFWTSALQFFFCGRSYKAMLSTAVHFSWTAVQCHAVIWDAAVVLILSTSSLHCWLSGSRALQLC